MKMPQNYLTNIAMEDHHVQCVFFKNGECSIHMLKLLESMLIFADLS